MVNLDLDLASILGIVMIFGSLGYFALSISQVIVASRSGGNADITIRIIQFIAAPAILFLSGIILLFNGWRQDQILSFKDLLLSILIGYLILIDLLKK